MRLILLCTAAFAGGCVLDVKTETDSFTIDEPFEGVIAEVGSGDIVLTAAATEGAQIYREIEYSSQAEPRLRAEVQDGILYLRADCDGSGWICEVNHDIVLPEGAWLEMQTGSGDIDAKGPLAGGWLATGSGDVALTSAGGGFDLETGSGDLSLHGVDGSLDLSTGSGDIDGVDLAPGTLRASTGSGDLTLDLGGEVQAVQVSSGSGDLDLLVPGGAYALDLSTGSGDVELTGVSDDGSAGRSISADTGSGDVRIQGK